VIDLDRVGVLRIDDYGGAPVRWRTGTTPRATVCFGPYMRCD